MNKSTELETGYANLWYYPEHKLVHHQFHKFAKGDNFRAVLTKGVELFEEHGCTKWLSDDRQIKVVSQEDAQWATENWNSRIKKAGWKYWALVMPQNVIGQMNIKKFIKTFTEMGITVEVFSEPDQAFNWIVEKN